MGVKVNGLISEVFGIRKGAVGTPTERGKCVRIPYGEG